MTRTNPLRVFIGLTLVLISLPTWALDGLAQDETTCLFKPVFHIPKITDVAKSPVGNIFALMEEGGQTYIWNAETNTVVASLASRTTAVAPVWSPTGDLIVTHSVEEVSLWNPHTGELIFTFAEYPVDLVDEIFTENITGISDKKFSPDGTLLAIAHTYDRTVVVYDTATGEVMYRFGDHDDGVQTLAFSPDGAILATASMWSSAVKLWNTETGQKLGELGETAEIVVFSPDGSMLATGSHVISGVASLDISIVSIWNVENRRKLMDFEAPLVVTDLRWMLDSKVIFAEFTSQTLPSEGSPFIGAAVRGWNTSTGQELYVFDVISDEVNAFAWSADMQLLATGTFSGSITIWDFEAMSSICSFEEESGILQFFWLDRDAGFITLSMDNTLTMWM